MSTEIKVKERPILFSGAMVRALLSGTKTQTRRVVKGIDIQQGEVPGAVTFLQDKGPDRYTYGSNIPVAELANPFTGIGALCPYGQPGERLWVRETWAAQYVKCSCYIQPCDCTTVRISYVADGANATFDDADIAEGWQMPKAVEAGKNGPCLFMPRWASRILLEIVSVRVERLQDINEADAVAEGIEQTEAWGGDWTWYQDYMDDSRQVLALESYRSLWTKINGPGSWEANPWVWVVEFRKL